MDRCPKESFSNNENDLVDCCDRVISHKISKMMQTKRGCIINLIIIFTGWQMKGGKG